MFTRDPDIIKRAFSSANKPSQARWNDLFDYMASVEVDIMSAHALLLQPVSLVPDAAGLLSIGPALAIGHRAKRLDNGVTYVKQRASGSALDDWESVGDTHITIPDVDGLQESLDLCLRGDVDDLTAFRIGARAIWHKMPSVLPGVDVQPLKDVVALPFYESAQYLDFVPSERNFTVAVEMVPPAQQLPGLIVHLLVRNLDQVETVEFVAPDDLPDTGNGTQRFVLLDAAFPVSIPPVSALWISVLQLPIPDADPSPAAGCYYFISFRQLH